MIRLTIAMMDELDCMMVELPYKGERIVMQVLLPNKRTGVLELEDKLMGADLQSEFRKMQHKVKVDLSLPKFKLSHSLPLSESLQEMGMGDMFSDATADFSGINGDRSLYVSKVMQKVFVEVNEEGSDAAAATGVVMMMNPISIPMQFTVDHPFRDSLTGMALFQGRVVQPTLIGA